MAFPRVSFSESPSMYAGMKYAAAISSRAKFSLLEQLKIDAN